MQKAAGRATVWLQAVRQLRRLKVLIGPGTGVLDDFSVSHPLGWPHDLLSWFLLARLMGVKVVLVYNAKRGQRAISDRIRVVFADEEVPEPVPDDDAPQDARPLIAALVAEERAGARPPLTGREAAAAVGFIKERQAQKLLAAERAKRAQGNQP